MIGVGEQVGGELVVIPYKTMLDIAPYAADTDFGKVFVHYITVECPYSDIHSESFGSGTPRVFFLQARVGECINGIGAVEYLGCDIPST